jgi:hypothetical protein
MIKPGSRPCYHSSTLLQWKPGRPRNCFPIPTHANDLGGIWQEKTINPTHLIDRDGGPALDVISRDTQVYIMYVRRCARINVYRVNANFQKSSECKRDSGLPGMQRSIDRGFFHAIDLVDRSSEKVKWVFWLRGDSR